MLLLTAMMVIQRTVHRVTQIDWSEFEQHAQNGHIESIKIGDASI